MALKMGSRPNPEANWGERTWALNHIAVGNLDERHMHELGLMDSFSVYLQILGIVSSAYLTFDRAYYTCNHPPPLPR